MFHSFHFIQMPIHRNYLITLSICFMGICPLLAPIILPCGLREPRLRIAVLVQERKEAAGGRGRGEAGGERVEKEREREKQVVEEEGTMHR